MYQPSLRALCADDIEPAAVHTYVHLYFMVLLSTLLNRMLGDEMKKNLFDRLAMHFL
jgi:hypothetical protein